MTIATDVERLAIIGRWLWRCCLSNGTPHGRQICERMKSPQPGDLVMEVTKFGPFDPESVGIFIERGGIGEGEYWLVQPLVYEDGRHVRWANAEFIALPDRFAGEWAEPAKGVE